MVLWEDKPGYKTHLLQQYMVMFGNLDQVKQREQEEGEIKYKIYFSLYVTIVLNQFVGWIRSKKT